MPNKKSSAKPEDRLRVNAVSSIGKGGSTQIVPFLEHPGTAVCLCLDKQQNVLVIEQYRPIVGKTLIEVPGGKLQAGESFEEAAIRETAEETGIRPIRVELVGSFFSSVGLTNERIHVFVSRKFSGTVRAEKNIRVFWVPLSKLAKMIRKKYAVDAKTALAVVLIESRLLA